MLVPFVVDVESLEPDQAWSHATLRACHHQLLDVWRRVGILVHDGAHFEKSSFYRAISDLPPTLKIMWLEMAKQLPSVPCARHWDGIVSPSHVQALCSDAALALVDDTRAEVEFGFTDDQDEVPFAKMEDRDFIICRLQAAQHTSVVQEAFSIAQRNIEIGESHQDIWKLRFRSLASAPSPDLKRIAIVDRFAVERHDRCSQDKLSGLERFLRLLDKDAGGPRYVTLYSALTHKLKERGTGREKLKAEMDAVFRKLPKKNIKRLMVHMVDNAQIGKNAQDRYIRFGRYVWELGHGLEIFEGSAAARPCQATFKSETSSHLKVEGELAGQTQAFTIKIPHTP